jgi:hypothetical protein
VTRVAILHERDQAHERRRDLPRSTRSTTYSTIPRISCHSPCIALVQGGAEPHIGSGVYCKAKIVESMTLRTPKMLSHKVRPNKEYSQYFFVLYCMDHQGCDETEHASHASLAFDMSVIFRPRGPITDPRHCDGSRSFQQGQQILVRNGCLCHPKSYPCCGVAATEAKEPSCLPATLDSSFRLFSFRGTHQTRHDRRIPVAVRRPPALRLYVSSDHHFMARVT